MGSSTIALAQIVALFVECIVYGIYLVSFALCLHILIWRKPRTEPYKLALIAVACLMFVFATFDVAFGLRLNLEAFIYRNSSATGASGVQVAEQDFDRLSYWVNDMRLVDYIAQTFIGDAMLLYRCFIVWGRQWKIITLPMLLWLGGAATGITVIYRERTSKQLTLITESLSITHFLSAVISITFVFNILTTSLIAYKIWSTLRETRNALRICTNRSCCASNIGSDHEMKDGHSSPRNGLDHAMRIIIESGALYSVAVAALFGTYVAQSDASYALSDAIIQIIGIVFNMIIIRVHQRRTCEFTKSPHPALSLPQFRHSHPQSSITVWTEVSNDSHNAMGLQGPQKTSAEIFVGGHRSISSSSSGSHDEK